MQYAAHRTAGIPGNILWQCNAIQPFGMNCFDICDAALNSPLPQALVFGRKLRNPRGYAGWLPDSPNSRHTGSAAMGDQDKVNRRDFIATSTAVAGAATALGSTALSGASAQSLLTPPPGF